MVIEPIATRIASQEVTNSSRFTIENGEPIKVCGIIVTGLASLGTTDTVEMDTGDASTTIHIFRLNTGTDRMVVLDVPFIADKGLSFIGGNAHAQRVSVFYMHLGG